MFTEVKLYFSKEEMVKFLESNGFATFDRAITRYEGPHGNVPVEGKETVAVEMVATSSKGKRQGTVSSMFSQVFKEKLLGL